MKQMPDPFDLERFVTAQEAVFEHVRSELRGGRKTSHWMWFVFPQMRGLGYSDVAQYYGISSRAEAEAYLQHPILGPRLTDCTRLVLDIDGRSLHDIFGTPDDLKFCSSMTLFGHAAASNQLFIEALEKYCSGRSDERTLRLLNLGS